MEGETRTLEKFDLLLAAVSVPVSVQLGLTCHLHVATAGKSSVKAVFNAWK